MAVPPYQVVSPIVSYLRLSTPRARPHRVYLVGIDSTVSVGSSYTLSKPYPRAPKTERAQVRIWHGICFARIRCVPFVPLV